MFLGTKNRLFRISGAMHLTFYQSTRKGIFLVLPRNLLLVKDEALGSTFENQGIVNLKKVRAEAKKLCKKLYLEQF